MTRRLLLAKRRAVRRGGERTQKGFGLTRHQFALTKEWSGKGGERVENGEVMERERTKQIVRWMLTRGWPRGETVGPCSEWQDTICTSSGKYFSNAAFSGAFTEVCPPTIAPTFVAVRGERKEGCSLKRVICQDGASDLNDSYVYILKCG